jgi:hypothetical protein
MTLFDLLDYNIKANPKYGSEKKGQPTTYYLSAAPEPIRITCEYAATLMFLSTIYCCEALGKVRQTSCGLSRSL